MTTLIFGAPLKRRRASEIYTELLNRIEYHIAAVDVSAAKYNAEKEHHKKHRETLTAALESLIVLARRLKSLGEAYDIAQTPFDLQTLQANIEAIADYLTKKY